MKTIDISTVKIDPNELKQRLIGADDGKTLAKAAEFECILRKNAECKYAFRETEISIENNKVLFEFTEIFDDKTVFACRTARIVFFINDYVASFIDVVVTVIFTVKYCKTALREQ